jgi:hypothetical protein
MVSVSDHIDVTYEIHVVLADDAEKLSFLIYYFVDINDAYVCCQELLCELGKGFSAIELIQTDDFDLFRLVERVTSDGCKEMKSLELILKELETQSSYCDIQKELERMRVNTRKLLVNNPARDDTRKKLRNILKGLKDTENKREREMCDI